MDESTFNARVEAAAEAPVQTEQTVEAETASSSAPESEPATQTEETSPDSYSEPSEAATSEQPEDKKSRAQERITQLSQRVKEAKAEADYWRKLSQPQPEAPKIESEDGYLTAEQIADAVDYRLSMKDRQYQAEVAKSQLAQDYLQAVESYPEVASDADLADMVVSMAMSRGITLTAAAERVIGRIQGVQRQAEARTMATEAAKNKSSSPQPGRVGNGEPVRPKLEEISENERRENWADIVSKYKR